jgi:hypothetical protein
VCGGFVLLNLPLDFVLVGTRLGQFAQILQIVKQAFRQTRCLWETVTLLHALSLSMGGRRERNRAFSSQIEAKIRAVTKANGFSRRAFRQRDIRLLPDYGVEGSGDLGTQALGTNVPAGSLAATPSYSSPPSRLGVRRLR